jgi:phosphoglucosamine mutase
VSASHNPYYDNGIKVFAAGGRKLSDAEEDRLEAELARVLARDDTVTPRRDASVGQVGLDPHGADRYAEQLVASLAGQKLGGMKVVVDCANGAASRIGPAVLEEVGLDVVAIHAGPDGTNINDGCGSTATGDLQRAVVDERADAGLAFDGDADRMVAVDNDGHVVDGDRTMAISALDLKERGRLARDTVVVTVMTNLGFRHAMAEHGIAVVETNVGDRYVLEAMEHGGFSLGGEQSGHIIFRDLATTGDGILTGLQLLAVVQRRRLPLATLAREVMTSFPQVLRNVTVSGRDTLAAASAVWQEVAAVEAELAGRGRVLLRPSGTEPVIRVMVEASTQQEAEAACARLCDVVALNLAG